MNLRSTLYIYAAQTLCPKVLSRSVNSTVYGYIHKYSSLHRTMDGFDNAVDNVRSSPKSKHCFSAVLPKCENSHLTWCFNPCYQVVTHDQRTTIKYWARNYASFTYWKLKSGLVILNRWQKETRTIISSFMIRPTWPCTKLQDRNDVVSLQQEQRQMKFSYDDVGCSKKCTLLRNTKRHCNIVTVCKMKTIYGPMTAHAQRTVACHRRVKKEIVIRTLSNCIYKSGPLLTKR